MKPLRASIAVVAALCLLSVSALPAYAAGDLTCTISGASEVTPDGKLDALAGGKNYYETVAGAEFIVQRDKGVMMGRFVSNAGWKVSVIDAGSATNSFKVLSTRPGGRYQSQYFEVRVQDKGDRKPFVLVAAEVLHGTCTP
ncbi:MAG: hypothetical protein RL404_1886 [Pseudomonadota bacterium]|jgi:hypothetical protein